MPNLQAPVDQARTLFDHLQRLRGRQRLLRAVLTSFIAYWSSLAAFYWLAESGSRDSAIAALVAVVMSSCWLPLQIHRAVEFTHGSSPVAWATATFLLGPVGALFVPAIQAFRLCNGR